VRHIHVAGSGVEDQTDRIGSGVHGGAHVLFARQAADLDARAGSSAIVAVIGKYSVEEAGGGSALGNWYGSGYFTSTR
jgi:hypothetical protein